MLALWPMATRILAHRTRLQQSRKEIVCRPRCPLRESVYAPGSNRASHLTERTAERRTRLHAGPTHFMKIIDRDQELAALAPRLQGARRLYLDTEFDSSKAGKKLSLVQIARDGAAPEEVFLVDALRIRDLTPLKPAFSDQGCEWVLHAGLQDIELLVERLAIEPPTQVFDTQVAWALLSPEASVSLSYLKFRLLGLRTGKPHQADDWLRRPLPESQLRYAASDIEHLPALREALGERADALARIPAIHQASREVAQPVVATEPELSLASFRNAWQLNRRTQAALRFLIDWYNQRPPDERRNAPDSKTMMAIASRVPPSSDDLARIKGVHRGWAIKHGARFTQLLQAAADNAKAEDFVPIDPAPYATFEEFRIEAWLGMARAEVCTRVSAAPDLVFPGRILKRVRDDLLDGRTLEQSLVHLGDWRGDLLRNPLFEFAKEQPLPRAES